MSDILSGSWYELPSLRDLGSYKINIFICSRCPFSTLSKATCNGAGPTQAWWAAVASLRNRETSCFSILSSFIEEQPLINWLLSSLVLTLTKHYLFFIITLQPLPPFTPSTNEAPFLSRRNSRPTICHLCCGGICQRGCFRWCCSTHKAKAL